MSKNVVKFYTTNEQPDIRIIDSNARIDQRLQELRENFQEFTNLTEISPSDDESVYEDAEFEGLDPAALEALMQENPDDSVAVIKASAENELREAQEKADEIVATAEQLANEYKENSRREAELEAGRIRANARQEGYNDGIEEAKREYEARMLALDAREAELNQMYEQAFAELEPQFVNTITDIYEHIFNVDLTQYSDVLAGLISNTMRRSSDSKAFIIHISSADFANITDEQREMLNASAPGARVELIEDIGLNKNQCLLETDNGLLDCGIDTQLSELRRRLLVLSYQPT